MTSVKWNDNYSVNIAEIDIQHRVFIKLINKLLKSVANGTSKEIISSIFKDLTVYAAIHFETEEDYFEKFNYPESSFHKQQHEDIAKKIEEFKKRNEEGREILDSEIVYFLISWFISHVMLIDKRFTKYLTENGLK